MMAMVDKSFSSRTIFCLWISPPWPGYPQEWHSGLRFKGSIRQTNHIVCNTSSWLSIELPGGVTLGRGMSSSVSTGLYGVMLSHAAMVGTASSFIPQGSSGFYSIFSILLLFMYYIVKDTVLYAYIYTHTYRHMSTRLIAV